MTRLTVKSEHVSVTACMHAWIFATTKTLGEAVFAATDNGLCLPEMHGDKSIPRGHEILYHV